MSGYLSQLSHHLALHWPRSPPERVGRELHLPLRGEGAEGGAQPQHRLQAEGSQVVQRVRQRLPIGGVASKRGLMDELAKFGLAEWAVERALLAMCQRGEMELRSEGKRIMRKRA